MQSLASYLWIPFVLQGITMVADEFYFHHKRGLPQWERLGHPLDTLTLLFCFGFTLYYPYSENIETLYFWISAFSCLFITKDEFVHHKECSAQEQWLHSLLFIFHPLVLIATYLFWKSESSLGMQFIIGQSCLLLGFLFYQILYWNFIWNKQTSRLSL